MFLHIKCGKDKSGKSEAIESLQLETGTVYSIVGKTGSGKTQLLEDIESFVCGDGITSREVTYSPLSMTKISVSHLSQNMNFILDLSVREFIEKRIKMSKSSITLTEFLSHANHLCGELIQEDDILTRLSGGQSRALMIADVAYNTSSNIILIDEIENAGIDKVKAIRLLIDKEKLVLVITHDPLLSLFGDYRIVMKNGGIANILQRTKEEEKMIDILYERHLEAESLRKQIREGNLCTLYKKKESIYAS